MSWSAAEGVTSYRVQYDIAADGAGCSDATHNTQATCVAEGRVWTNNDTADGPWINAGWSAGESVRIVDLTEGSGGLTPGTTYYVRVAAVSPLGVSVFAEGVATPSDAFRAPGPPENVVLLPTPGGLMLSWDPPRDRGNPGGDTVQYAVLVKPEGGWNCEKPGGGRWTVNDANDPEDSDFPLWVAVYCVTDEDENYVEPDALEDGTGWAKVTVNITGPEQPVVYGLYSFELTHLPEDLTYEVQMQSVGPSERVEDPPNSGTYRIDRYNSAWVATDPTTASPAARLPGSPTNLTLTTGVEEITVTWDDPLDEGDPPLEGWIVQWRETPADPQADWDSYEYDIILLDDQAEGGSHDLTSLTNNQEYQVRVAAFHNTALHNKAVEFSEDVTVTYVFTAPAGETACPTDGTDPTGDCYVLITESTVTYVLAAADAGSLPLCPTIPTVACHVVIEAASMDEPGSIGDYATGKATPVAEQPPGVPRNLRLGPGDQSIGVAWDAPESLGNPPLDGYVIQWRTAGFCSDPAHTTQDACTTAGAAWTPAAATWSYAVTLGVDGTDYELGGFEIDEQGNIERCFDENGQEIAVPENTEGCFNEDGIVNGVEYEVRVAAYHKLPVAASADVRVVAVLDTNDLPGLCSDTAYTTEFDCTRAGEMWTTLPECSDTDTQAADCYFVLSPPTDYIGLWTDPTAKATPQAQTILAVSGDSGPPAPPRNLVLTPGAGQIEVTWDAPETPDPNHAGYIVQYRALGSTTWIDYRRIDTDDKPNTDAFDETAAVRTATITGLGEGTYEVRVGTLICEAYCDPPESGQPPPRPRSTPWAASPLQ